MAHYSTDQVCNSFVNTMISASNWHCSCNFLSHSKYSFSRDKQTISMFGPNEVSICLNWNILIFLSSNFFNFLFHIELMKIHTLASVVQLYNGTKTNTSALFSMTFHITWTLCLVCHFVIYRLSLYFSTFLLFIIGKRHNLVQNKTQSYHIIITNI